ncbi:hypothetical protein VTP01DRAFT_9555 [Rhizomucor pusillus]|uniref:uncharacterized protein n=1 Tax=Rhizomucor pusillus TaxID=4840 RepID=UPI0037428CCF
MLGQEQFYFISVLVSMNAQSDLATAKRSVKKLSYERDDSSNLIIYIEEILDSRYGCYIWPSAVVMAEYIWHNRTKFSDRVVLEIGAGTSLPSILLSKGVSAPPRLILTDIPGILHVIRSCLLLNGVKEESNSTWIRGLLWGELEGDTGVKSLTASVEQEWRANIDYILGSDTFYDPADFEKLIVTVSYIIHCHNPKCKFITAYQERSSKRSIQPLLDKYQLECSLVSRDSFDFDASKYIRDDDNDGEEEDDIRHAKVDAGGLSSVFLLEISAKTSTNKQ